MMKLPQFKSLLFFIAIGGLAIWLFPRGSFLALMNENTHNPNASIRLYEERLIKNPYDVFSSRHLVSMLEDAGDLEKARHSFKRISQLRNKDFKFAREYIDYVEKVSAPSIIAQEKLEMVHRFSKFPETDKVILIGYLEDAYNYFLLAQNLTQAKLTLKKIMELTEQIQERAHDYVLLCVDSNTISEAINFLKKNLKLDSSWSEGNLLLVELLVSEKRWEEAYSFLSSLPKMVMSRKEVLLRQLEILSYLDKPFDAKNLLEELLLETSGQEKKEITLQLAELEKKQGNLDQALERYKEALLLDPSDLSLLSEILSAGVSKDILLSQYWPLYAADEKNRNAAAQMLAQALLFQLHDFDAAFFKDYLSQKYDEAFAQDTLYFISRNQPEKLRSWLVELKQMGYSSKKILETEYENLLLQKETQLAFDFLKRNQIFTRSRWLLELARMSQSLKLGEEANRYYTLYAEAVFKEKGNRVELLKELYRAGQDKLVSRFFPETASGNIANKTKDPEVWFLRSEMEYSRGNEKEGKESAKKVLELLKERGNKL